MVAQALYDAGKPAVDNGNGVLFNCEGGDEGIIKVLNDCGLANCTRNGDGHVDDFCGPWPGPGNQTTSGNKTTSRRHMLGGPLYRL